MAERVRRLAWDACLNIRDVGGYQTIAGTRTRWDVLVRADYLCRLTPAGRAALLAYGVRTVIDLRHPWEVARALHPFAPAPSGGRPGRRAPGARLRPTGPALTPRDAPPRPSLDARQHSDFLPLITDTAVACVIPERLRAAYDLFLLPPVTLSCSQEQEGLPGLPGAVSLSARTLAAVLEDVRASLRRGGIERLVVVSGHGGNYVLQNVVHEANVAGPASPIVRSWSGGQQDA